MTEPKTPCRTPAEGRDGVTNISTWKFELIRGYILDLAREAGDAGAAFSDLKDAVAKRLTDDERARLGSVGWYATTVKLEMEVADDIERIAGVSPQRFRIA